MDICFRKINHYSVGIFLILFVTICFGFLGTAAAKPEFAARESKPCWHCHVNPSGGSVRNPTGFFYAQQTALKATTNYLDENFKDFGEFTPLVGDHLQLGADLRAMWHDINEDEDVIGDETTNSSTFYLMEAAFYADAHLLPVLHLVGGYDAAQEIIEAYGMIDELPAGLYFKAGRFLPPFGIRLDDHTAYTRSRNTMGFDPTALDSGVEAGVRPGPFYLMASLTNGNPGEQAQDRDGDYYAVAAQTGVHFWKVNFGGSFYHNTRDRARRYVYGPFMMAGLWKFAYIGEMDIFDQEQTIEDDQGVIVVDKDEFISGWAVNHQLDVEIIQGIYLQARYSHFDPNWDYKDDHVYQVMGGVNFFPLPYLETYIQYRYNWEYDDPFNDEIMVQAHLWF